MSRRAFHGVIPALAAMKAALEASGVPRVDLV